MTWSAEYIGIIAGIFVASSLLPQVLKSLKTKSTKDISLAWSVINLTGQFLWLLYGVIVGSISLITMTALTFFMVMIMVVLKIKFG